MAKSKLVKANEKIAEKVVGGYKKIEESVVGGYKKIENGAVGGFTKISDTFVDQFLTKDGETVEEAKKDCQKSRRKGKQRETQKWREKGDKKEYFYSNDFRNHRRHFICAGNVHGFDSGVGRFQARRGNGRNRSSSAADYGACLEKNRNFTERAFYCSRQ